MIRVRLSVKRKAELFTEHEGRCHICNGKISVGEAWDVEHPIPLANGGSDDEANWRPAHVKCHKRKTAEDAGKIAKTKRVRARHMGIRRERTMRGWRRFNGQVVYADRDR
jgi:5-methylcytosine-specific restriction enzyme A